jgi:hypothetical protein
MKFFKLLSCVLSTSIILHLQTDNSQAVQQVCNRNPGQEANVSTARSKSARVQSYVVKVQLRYNRKTQEKWSRACIPVGTKLYLKDKNGNIYGSYTAQINGWNYADKIQLTVPVKACAKHPSDPREFCTSFG